MKTVIMIGFLLLSVNSVAIEKEVEPEMREMEKDFLVQKAVIVQDIEAGKLYKDIADEDLQSVKDALERMSDIVAGADNVEDLKVGDKALLITNQSLINTILTMAENDTKIVCSRRGRVGSHLKKTTCETMRDRRVRQEAERMMMREYQRSSMSPPE